MQAARAGGGGAGGGGRRRRPAGPVPILMYHRVDGAGPAGLSRYRVAPADFAAQMEWLHREGYRTLPIEEAAASHVAPGGPEGRWVAITFDDGYADFALHAWPVLARFGLAATVFLPTGLIGRRAEWDGRFGEPAPLMSWEDVARLGAGGVAFGAHGVTHRRMTRLAPERRRAELAQSRAAIAARAGVVPVDAFCYPFGDFDREVMADAAAAGYRFALAAGRVPPGNAHAVPRVAVDGGDDIATFAARIAAARAPWRRPPAPAAGGGGAPQDASGAAGAGPVAGGG